MIIKILIFLLLPLSAHATSYCSGHLTFKDPNGARPEKFIVLIKVLESKPDRLVFDMTMGLARVDSIAYKGIRELNKDANGQWTFKVPVQTGKVLKVEVESDTQGVSEYKYFLKLPDGNTLQAHTVHTNECSLTNMKILSPEKLLLREGATELTKIDEDQYEKSLKMLKIAK
jgi:hypothetical protein